MASTAPKKRRFGMQTVASSGGSAVADDTPRGLIKSLAAATDSSAASAALPSSSEATPRDLIKGFHGAALTGTASTRESGAQFTGGVDQPQEPQRLVAVPSAPADEHGLPLQDAGPRLALQERRPSPATAAKKVKVSDHHQGPREFPSKMIRSAAVRFTEQLPKPNSFTSDAMELLLLSASEFFPMFADEYKHYVRLNADPRASTALSRRYISLLMHERGLIGEEGILRSVGRLLDREDADLALGVPLSAAEKARRRGLA